MSEMDERLAVVEAARSWLLTPYHNHARVKGSGVDCVHLLAAAWIEAGLVSKIDPGWYSPEWHLHHSEEKYIEGLLKFSRKVERDPLPADIAMFQYGRTSSHAAIVVDWPLMIHSYRGRGVEYVKLSDACFRDKKGGNRLTGIYSFW